MFAAFARASNQKGLAVFWLRIRNRFLARKTEQRGGTHSPRMFFNMRYMFEAFRVRLTIVRASGRASGALLVRRGVMLAGLVKSAIFNRKRCQRSAEHTFDQKLARADIRLRELCGMRWLSKQLTL